MYDDLEAIANLEYGKAIERISREAQEKIRSVETMPRGGQMEYARLKVHLDQSEESCRAYAQIWQDLLEAKNGGHLKPQRSLQKRPCVVTSKPAIWDGPGRDPFYPAFS